VTGSIYLGNTGVDRHHCITWEYTVKQTESVPSSAFGSVLKNMLRGVFENILKDVLRSIPRLNCK